MQATRVSNWPMLAALHPPPLLLLGGDRGEKIHPILLGKGLAQWFIDICRNGAVSICSITSTPASFTPAIFRRPVLR